MSHVQASFEIFPIFWYHPLSVKFHSKYTNDGLEAEKQILHSKMDMKKDSNLRIKFQKV